MSKSNISSKHIGWIRILLFFIPYVFIGAAFHSLGYLWVREGLDQGNWQLSSIEDLSYAIFYLLGTLFTVWIFMRFVDKEAFTSLGLRIKNRFTEIGLGLGIGANAIGLGFLIIWSQNQIHFDELNFNFNELLAAIFLFLIIAIHEEVLIRGYILKNLMVSFNKYLALLISAALFTLMHSGNQGTDVLAYFNLFLAGLLLGSYYIYTKNLWFPIAMHFSWNFFQSILGFNVSGHDSYSLIKTSIPQANQLNGGQFGFEGSIFSTIIELIILIALLYYGERNLRLNREEGV